MSLKEGSNPEKVHKLVSEFIPESTVASSAGTELSLRLPREAVPVFPDVFEQIETESESLGIMSYGIETTTLEEVFMRIVNEDAETLLMNHEEANRMLTASKEERDIHSKKLEERDMTRNPWKEDTLQALLVKGTGDESIMDALIPQTKVMIRKRLFQFVRSRGQWAMGVVVPFVIAIMVGALLRTSPTEILSEQDTPITATVLAPYPVPVAGPSESLTNAYIADAFGNSIDTTYVGENYTALYNYIALVATEGSSGASGASSMGIAYDSSDSLFNFTVLYNQTYPMNFGATVQTLLNAAVANATNNLLTVDQTYASLPANKLNSQVFSSLTSILIF